MTHAQGLWRVVYKHDPGELVNSNLLRFRILRIRLVKWNFNGNFQTTQTGFSKRYIALVGINNIVTNPQAKTMPCYGLV